MLRIGPYTFPNCVALAPMAGVTDLPFRQLCRDLGAGLVVSEMLGSDPALYHTRKSRLRRRHDGEASPRIVQIAGGDPEQMAAAARLNVAEGADIIDINMGCPAKKVCRKAAGSALLRDEALVAAILQQVVSAVDVPVTLKIRTGWSPEFRNGVRIARIAEQAGIAALAVHGRTRACKFNGAVEYDSIAEIVAAVSIPVLANGDIDSPARAQAVLAHTGAAGVMVGRAAQGRPWLPGLIAAHLAGTPILEPDADAQSAILLRHLRALHEFYGARHGVRIARKHVGWYLSTTWPGRAFCRTFNALESASGQYIALGDYFADRRQQASAEAQAA
jgi:tRNA-dihydrouridine synthase B